MQYSKLTMYIYSVLKKFTFVFMKTSFFHEDNIFDTKSINIDFISKKNLSIENLDMIDNQIFKIFYLHSKKK